MHRLNTITLAATALLGTVGAAQATEFGTVTSSTPVYAQVAVPQRQCTDAVENVGTPTTGAGAVMGAIVGGVLGSTIGRGGASAVGAGIGAVTGAAVGNDIEASNTPPEAATVRRCQVVRRYENRVVAYDVAYDYNGAQYTARMHSPPSDKVALNANLTPQDIAPPAPVAAVAPAPAPVYVTPAPTVVYADPLYYPGPVVYAAPRIWIGGGWGWGYHRWR